MPPSPCSAGTKFPSPDNFEQKPALDSASCQSQGYRKANAKYVQSEHKANAEQAKQALRIRHKSLATIQQKAKQAQSSASKRRTNAGQAQSKRGASAEQVWGGSSSSAPDQRASGRGFGEGERIYSLSYILYPLSYSPIVLYPLIHLSSIL